MLAVFVRASACVCACATSTTDAKAIHALYIAAHIKFVSYSLKNAAYVAHKSFIHVCYWFFSCLFFFRWILLSTPLYMRCPKSSRHFETIRTAWIPSLLFIAVQKWKIKQANDILIYVLCWFIIWVACYCC